MYKVQSILFDKTKNSLIDVIKYCRLHKLIYNKIDETERFYRVRQQDPQRLEQEGFNKVITKKIDPYRDISYIIYYK